MNEYRTHSCGELRLSDVNKDVRLAGFVQKIRNLGKMIFIDLRDENGITQVVVNEESNIDLSNVNKECTITVYGKVVERSSKNSKLPTGDIEIEVKSLEVLGKCRNSLPFEINDDSQDVREDLRLQYRFLDLRNEKLHNNIRMRSKIMKDFRAAMDELGFIEIQTPILTSSSPEGARDFIVPSRIHPGEFYALPQAPQQFKQLLMVSGFEKYYQIAPCFRDEDPRADRSPGEFYQLDFEMAFSTQEDVFEVMERVLPKVFKQNSTWKVDEGPFVRIPYKEAMEKYGSDKPDLRNPLIIHDLTDIFESTEFNAFKNKTVKAIVTENMEEKPRKFFDTMSEYAVSELEAKGLAWVKIDNEGNLNGGISKFIDDDRKEKIFDRMQVKNGSAIFFIADEIKKAEKIAGGVRIKLGEELDILEKEVYRFCWIVDFPMYELSDEGTIDFNHNPFSMPQGGLEALNTMNPLDIVAYQYDIVCNGLELSSGAVRNHDQEIMIKAFEIAGYTEEDVKGKFGALYNAFSYGTPPHAGAAPGLDRIIMLLEDEGNIREVIAFPKNKKARDLLMGAPSSVTEKQLEEVHIKIVEDK
ncbi:MAG: aspartate--tRNA ligase [Clostridia bacterium]|nr:aspartate--tRNA ligase [Clostridia bacterium]